MEPSAKAVRTTSETAGAGVPRHARAAAAVRAPAAA